MFAQRRYPSHLHSPIVRVPKNLVDLCGKPLVAWSIATGQALVEARALARCIVSTDDDSIAAAARSFGADVPFRRLDAS